MWENRTFMWVWDRLTSRTEWLLKNACWVWIYLQFYSVLGLGYVMLCMSSLVFVYISMLFGVVVVGELTFEFWLLFQLFFFTCFLNSNHFGFSCLVVLLSILLLFFVVVVGMFLIGAEIGSGLMMFSCFADIPILNTSH